MADLLAKFGVTVRLHTVRHASPSEADRRTTLDAFCHAREITRTVQKR